MPDDPQPKANPSGATDKTKERERKFDEEGGDQPQARSQREVDAELEKVRREEKSSASDALPIAQDWPLSMGSEGLPHSKPHKQPQ
jgi:hypothetical protein